MLYKQCIILTAKKKCLVCAYMKVRIKLKPTTGDFQVTNHTLRSKFHISGSQLLRYGNVFQYLLLPGGSFRHSENLVKVLPLEVRCPSISLQVLPSTRRFGKLVETTWREFQTPSHTNEFKLLNLTRGIKCIENTKNKTRFEITTTLDNFGEQCY